MACYADGVSRHRGRKAFTRHGVHPGHKATNFEDVQFIGLVLLRYGTATWIVGFTQNHYSSEDI